MIITFQGVESKVGTSMIAQSFAETLARQNPNEKILYLIFSPSRGRTYIKEEFPYLDSIIPALKSKLSPRTIFENANWKNNLCFFGGTARRFKVREYEPEMAFNILEVAKANFDKIVIDAGNTMDFGLSMPAVLNASDKLCYVLSQNVSAAEELVDLKRYFEYYDINPDIYILNKVESSDLYTPFVISNKIEVPLNETLLYQIPLMKKGRRAETEASTFCTLKEKEWIKNIEKLTEILGE